MSFRSMALCCASVGLLLLGTVSVCIADQSAGKKGKTDTSAQPPWDSARAALQYTTILTELDLAATEKPYLVIDLKKRELQIRLKGAPVWAQSIAASDNDSDAVIEFGETFLQDGKTPVRDLERVHLFSSRKQTPDSILKIVAEASKVDAALLQRVVPGRFQLVWKGGLVLDIVTDTEAETHSSINNTLVEMTQVLKLPFGLTRLQVTMKQEAAITLYHMAEPGLPTLIISG